MPVTPPSFLAGDSEMARIMRDHDWSASPLGPPCGWSRALRAVAFQVLNSRHPMFVFWGTQHAFLYNDACRDLIGPQRHPSSLGRRGEEVWAEIWEVIGPQIDLALTGGGATWHENHLVPITRGGVREDVYWTYSHSPLLDEDAEGGIGGVLVVATDTTAQVVAERRRAERADAEEAGRETLARLFAQAPSFIAVLDGPRHRFVLTNQAYKTLTGGRDVLGRTVAEALPEAVEQGYVDLLDRVFASGEAFTSSGAKYSVPLGPGGTFEDRFLDFIYQPILDEDGRVSGIFVEGTDVSARTEAEREMRRTAHLLRTIVETAPGIIYGKDTAGRMLIANSAALDLIGKSWAEVEGRTDTEFLADKAEGEAIMANDRMVIASGRTQELEEPIRRPGELPHIFLSKKTPMRDADGKVVGLVGVSVDITDRKMAEQALQRLNADLEARVAERSAELDRTWRNSQDLLCIIGPDDILKAANPAWTAVLGWLPEEVVGRHHLEFNHPDHRTATADAAKTAPGGRLQNHVIRNRHKDGSTRWISWSASGEGGSIYASGRDVTTEREAADAVARAEDLVRQAQKMEAVGQLTGGIAHDFNNMLQGISSAVELMRRRIEEGRPDEAARYLAPMRRSVDRAAALTNRLLAFSRRQALAPRRVNLDELIPGAAALIRQTVGPAIEVALGLEDDCWPVRCDANQLENALLNLAINARDAMLPDGGLLRIATAHVRFGADDVALWPDCHPGEFVRVSVRDTGCGMLPDVMEHAFEPFFTTKPAGQGTGLGLSQVFGFVSQSHGLVQLDSTPGQGTSVHLFLPRFTGPDTGEADEEHGQPAERRTGDMVAGALVLLVEDEIEVRRLASEALHDLGCAVIEAATGSEALGVLRQPGRCAAERIDMLVADIGLPGGINGRQLADAARELHPGLPVLLVTGYAGKALGGDADLGQGVSLLGKPFALDELTSRVRAALTRGSKKT